MDLKQLAALITVGDVGSVTKAAELLHVVQPAVTKYIRSLESELGVELFTRTRHGMVPTPSGAVVIDRARRALTELDRARAEVQQREDANIAGIVTVGLLESVVSLVAEPLAATIRSRYPALRVRLVTGYSGHLRRWLDDGDVDLSLLYDLAGTPSIHARQLAREALWAVGPAQAELSAAKAVTLRDVSAHPLVLPVPGHGLRALIDQALSALDGGVEIAIETNSLAIQKMLVASGHGWTILPAAGVAGDLEAEALSAAPLQDPALTRQIMLGLPRVGRRPPAVDVVAAALDDVVTDAVRSGAWPTAALVDPATG